MKPKHWGECKNFGTAAPLDNEVNLPYCELAWKVVNPDTLDPECPLDEVLEVRG